ncbi:MAG: DNA internalization-related competence protein ComEC/Rec2 [Lachnospiraceae bacterium]|nr:DNA internalization-related competence protein ComEC/Rec2 [Lachnospiraceae bacterium]
MKQKISARAAGTRRAFRPGRPLALVCLAFTVMISVFLTIFGTGEDDLPCADGERVRTAGRVVRKEMRRDSRTGESAPVLYIDTAGDRSFRVQCYMDPSEDMDSARIGEEVLIAGTARHFRGATNPGEFDSAAYYRVMGIAYRISGAVTQKRYGRADLLREGICGLRLRFAETIDKCLDTEDAGIMRAMLLGDKSAMDSDIRSLYKRSGIIHILAISGLHITLIGMGIYDLLSKLSCPRWIASSASVPVMLAYGELCGMSSSCVRAMIMFFLKLTASVFGFSYDMLTALAVAGVTLAVEQPLYLTYSGFWLSFLAVLAITALSPVLICTGTSVLHGSKSARILQPFIASLSVVIMTLPVYMLVFHVFPVYSVILNLLVIPLMSAVLVSGIACMTVGTFLVPAGTLIGSVDHVILRIFKAACLAQNSLPGAVWVTGHAEVWQVCVYYGMILCMMIYVYVYREHERRCKKRGTGGILRASAVKTVYIAAAVLILSLRFKPELRITVLDVGQGDGIVIEGDGLNILLDGGSSSRSGVGSAVIEPYLEYEGISKLDAMIVTHGDDDHVNGVQEILDDPMRTVKVDMLVVPDVSESTGGENLAKLIATAESEGIKVSRISRGQRLTGGDMTIDCLGPSENLRYGDPNEASVILSLNYGGFSALLTGDVEGAGQEELKQYILSAEPDSKKSYTLLKVAHHGSGYTTDADFLDLVKPVFAAISCGRNNRYGHPHQDLLDRLEDAGARIHSTAVEGALFMEVNRGTASMSGFLEKKAID